jgi:hypothetical protein
MAAKRRKRGKKGRGSGYSESLDLWVLSLSKRRLSLKARRRPETGKGMKKAGIQESAPVGMQVDQTESKQSWWDWGDGF